MSLQVEKLEKNTAKLTVEVPAEQFAAAIQNAYKKNKGRFNIPGFRKGKAPFEMIKKMYGVGVFYEDAVNEVIDATYPKAAEESGLEIVSRPSISVDELEDGKPVVYSAVVAVKPEVTLGEYKGVEVQRVKADVLDEDIESEINSVREKNSRLITVEDRGVEDKDHVTIDFDGYVDGKRFDGGKSEDYPLVIGSHTFIDTFEEQLIGKKTGEECEVNVTFPEEYHVDELKGKPALFKVKIKEIQKKELPELDDDFAQDVSDFDTLDEYKADVEKKILENKENQIKREQEDQIIEKIIENAQMEIPQQMITAQTRQMTQEFAQRLQSQGLSLEQYMQFTGLTPQKMMEDLEPQALKRIQSRLVLEAVVVAENIEASDEEIDKELENMASMYQMEIDKLKELIGDDEKKQIGMDLAVQKAVEFVVKEAVEK